MSVSSWSKTLEKSSISVGSVDKKPKKLITDCKANGEKTTLRLTKALDTKPNILQTGLVARRSTPSETNTKYADKNTEHKESEEELEDGYWSQFRVSRKRHRRPMHIPCDDDDEEESEEEKQHVKRSNTSVASKLAMDVDDEKSESGSLANDRFSRNDERRQKQSIKRKQELNDLRENMKARRLRRKQSLERSVGSETKKKEGSTIDSPNQAADVAQLPIPDPLLERSAKVREDSVDQDTPKKSRGRRACKDPNKTDKSGRTKLFGFAGAGNIEAVKDLIERGADVNIKDNAGWTPLHEAALKGKPEIVRYMVACGADLNARGFGGDTPLHDACSNGYTDCVRILVEAGADVFAVNENKQQPIDVCEDTDCERILQAKMDELDHLVAQDKDGRTILHRACANGEYNQVLMLLEKGANVNMADSQSWTPLHEAAKYGHTTIVELLVSYGALVNSRGFGGDTALHNACHAGHEDTVKSLIQAGADVCLTNDTGKDAYHVCQSTAIRRMLMAKMDKIQRQKATSDALDEIAATSIRMQQTEQDVHRPLSREERKIQSYMRAFEVMEQGPPKRGRPKAEDIDIFGQGMDGPFPMVSRKKRNTQRERKSSSMEAQDLGEESSRPTQSSKKLDPYKKDRCGRTQLFKWSSRGDMSRVASLLEAGANPNEVDYAGWTPLHEACLEGHADIVRLLLQKGADVNSEGADSDTPLHDATENSHVEVVKVLLDHGARANAANAKGKTALDIAVDNEDRQIEQLIRNSMTKAESGLGNKKRGRRLVKRKNEASDRSLLAEVQPGSTDEVTPAKVKTRRLVPARELDSKRARKDRCEVRASSSPDVSVKMEVSSEGSVDALQPDQKPLQGFLGEESKAQAILADAVHSRAGCAGYPSEGARTPIPTPPPDNWTGGMKVPIKKETSERVTSPLPKPVLEEASRYLPLYTVQLMENDEPVFFVVDLQVSLLLGIPMEVMWTNYSFLARRVVNVNQKKRLWSPLASMLYPQQARENEKQAFLETRLHFVRLDQVVALIKAQYNHLSQCMITTTIDMGYQDSDAERSPSFSTTTPFLKSRPSSQHLPPKIAMKMKKCGLIRFNHDATT
ncbi:hypothetical protein EC973_006370 [Apophysomyces ossiformis]|uniref:Uncharacterized protein n=1 Tax=Apophysomyces ossiformis TaxID=679940 RepID=A0A8H7BZ02_9FUNG|nr:hypothetical protein EC973_006370 [Apophysomyces ossiformis]